MKKKAKKRHRVFEPLKIVARRKQLHVTQTALAKDADLNRGYLIDIEQGGSIPTASVIARLAYALKVRENYFFADSV